MLPTSLPALPPLQPFNAVARKPLPQPVLPPAPPTVQADTFVKTAPQALPVSEVLSVQARAGENIPPISKENAMKIAFGMSILCVLALVCLIPKAAKEQYNFQKKVIKDALKELNDENDISTNQLRTPSTSKARSGEFSALVSTIIIPAVIETASIGITTGIDIARSHYWDEPAAELLHQETIKFNQEVLRLQKELAQKLEAGFNALQKQGKLLTPTTFLEMVPHLGLPTEQAEIVRETVNHAIEAMNDTKPLQHFAFKDGASLLLRAKNQRGNPEMQEIFLQEGVDVVKAARPKINGMLQYKAHHLLEKLQTELATVYQQLEEPQKAQQYLKQAKASGISALEEGGYARFVAGFLEGLINFQRSQFNPQESEKLQHMLNLVAKDVRPLAAVSTDLPFKLFNEMLNVFKAYEKGVIREAAFLQRLSELNLALISPDSTGTKQWADACRSASNPTWETINELNQSKHKLPALIEPLKQMVDALKDTDSINYRAIEELSPFPQTYAAELPHREALLAKGVKFEPYPNA